jgi:hypothetical protein
MYPCVDVLSPKLQPHPASGRKLPNGCGWNPEWRSIAEAMRVVRKDRLRPAGRVPRAVRHNLNTT